MLIRRTRPVFRGYTNADGTRKESAPPSWPFGTIPPGEALMRRIKEELQKRRTS